jgi:uncharacterized protein YozE (UPF0346 family)
MQNFYDWFVEKYDGKNSPRGDLAGDMQAVDDFPKEANTCKAILEHLESRNACDACISVFKRAWKAYEKRVLAEK